MANTSIASVFDAVVAEGPPGLEAPMYWQQLARGGHHVRPPLGISVGLDEEVPTLAENICWQKVYGGPSDTNSEPSTSAADSQPDTGEESNSSCKSALVEPSFLLPDSLCFFPGVLAKVSISAPHVLSLAECVSDSTPTSHPRGYRNRRGLKEFQEELVDPTTICFKNIPNCYSKQMVFDLLDSGGFNEGYDFMYVPHSTKRLPRFVNLGYFFVNFVSHEVAVRAWERFSGFKEWVMPSDRIMVATWASSTQGQNACVKRFHGSNGQNAWRVDGLVVQGGGGHANRARQHKKRARQIAASPSVAGA